MSTNILIFENCSLSKALQLVKVLNMATLVALVCATQSKN